MDVLRRMASEAGLTEQETARVVRAVGEQRWAHAAVCVAGCEALLAHLDQLEREAA